jgi:hypothetical protein
MANKNDKSTNVLSPKQNGLGPVAREKYESILQARVRQCIAGQEAKIKAQRAKALKIYLYCQLYRKMILPLQAWSEA